MQRASVSIVAWAALASTIAYTALSWTSRQIHPLPLTWFYCILSVPAALWVATWLYLRRSPATSGVVLTCAASAVAFRIAGFFGAPLYEDDYFRYMWDGYVFATRGTPYGVLPASFFGFENLPGRMGEILSQVNYPDIPTIYGPVCEIVFLLAYKISPGELWPLKVLFILADLGLASVVWVMTRSAAALVLYAWAPLVVKEIAFTAHPDVLTALFAALAAAHARNGRRLLAAAMLGAAVSTKALAVVLLPFVIRTRDWRAVALLMVVVGCFYAPFLIEGSSDLAGLTVFADEWEFNSFGYAVVAAALGPAAAKALSPLLLIASIAALWRYRRELFRPDVVLLLVFLFSPVVNPWYLVLLAPFVALQPSWWGITVLLSVLLSYATGMNLGREEIGQFDHPWWVRPAEAILVVLAAAYDNYRQRV